MEIALNARDLTRVYEVGQERVYAVDSVSVSVFPGEVVVVMGPSGAGKTTLLLMCGGLLRPTSGHVWIGSKEITRMPPRGLSALRLRSVGFVFQNFNLLANLTAAENVRIVQEAAGVGRHTADHRSRQLLSGVGLSPRLLDAPPSELSGGEQQRVAIARALANNPSVILADEPTGNLDSRTGHQVVQLLRELTQARSMASLVATHDSRIADIADHVLWLEDGRIHDADFRPVAPSSARRTGTPPDAKD